MAMISKVSESNTFVPEYMPVLVRINRTPGLPDKERVQWIGTVFVVGIQMLFTAKHVAQQLLKDDPALAQGKPSQYQYAIIQVRKTSNELFIWNIHTIGMIDNCDIAVITLSPAHSSAQNYLHWSGLPLTLIPPRVGDRVAASGIHQIHVKQVQLNGESIHIDIDVERSFSEGVVKDVHFEQRDRGLYSWPCFQVDAQFDPGMSGGYIVNERNEVCGVVCGSLGATSPDEEHISYGSLLWPTVSLPIPPQWIPNAPPEQECLLWDYYHRVEPRPIGIDRVNLRNELATGGSLISSYTDPS